MLADRYAREHLRSVLAKPGDWRPLPPQTDRQAWAGLDRETRQALIAAGESAMSEPWPHLPATLLLDFARTGNRERYQQPERARREILRRLVLAECAEGGGRFVDAVADALWSICEESTWCWPAHLHAQRAGTDLPDPDEPVVDLGVGESAALVAWSDHLLREPLDGVSMMLHKRVAHEIARRVLIPCRERDDFWWMGFTSKRVNNWCPWVVSNWLTCLLLLEDDLDHRATDAAKALRSLDKFIGEYHDDGGCDEGPSYWGRAGASLFDCLDLLHDASGGAVDIYSEARIANMARYIHRAHVAGAWYVNFADAPARVQPAGGLVYRFGRAVDDEPTATLGAWLWQQRGARAALAEGSMWRTGRALFHAPGISEMDAAPPLVRDVWLNGIEVMVARDRAGSDTGLTLAAKGGHNAESHNHNDIGHFILYTDGRPALVDAGVGVYTRQTFSPQRYDLWTMQSAYHALPTIDDVQQRPGREFAARDVAHAADDHRAALTLDLAHAYPAEAGLARWRREVALHRGEAVVLSDAYELANGAGARPGPGAGARRGTRQITLSLMTPSEVETAVDGALALLRPRDLGNGCTSGALTLRLEAGPAPEVSVETLPLDDAKLSGAWGDKLHRLVLRWSEPAQTGGWTLRFEPG